MRAGEVHAGDYCQPLERAEVAREGTDVTIFCYSRMRYVVMQAVAAVEKEGYNPEASGGGGGWVGVRGWVVWEACARAGTLPAPGPSLSNRPPTPSPAAAAARAGG